MANLAKLWLLGLKTFYTCNQGVDIREGERGGRLRSRF